MATSGKDTGIVGYNVQTAVDTKNHIIVAHEVTNVGTDRRQLSNMAEQARTEMGVETLDAVADRGYYTGEEILAYLGEVIDEYGLDQYIRYQHRVTAASWSTEDRRWTVEVTRGDTGQRLRFTTGFLWMCQGYYNHAKPYRPEWDGMDRFQGLVVHPQRWPEDLDLAGKRVVVIGSGATAATLIPAIAAEAQHVTMLQRSPTYYFAPPTTHELAVQLEPLDLPDEWMHEIMRRQYMTQYHWLARTSFEAPDELHAFLPSGAARRGQFPALTGREAEILERIAQGLDNAQIAARLDVSEKTVRNNITHIFDKLAVENRSQAIVLARNNGFGKADGA